MDPGESLSTSFWVMIFLQSIGSVDMPGSGDRKMPAPRAYIAAIITWEGLNILASTGRARAASIAGWIMVLTAIVVGPFGEKLSNLFKKVADTYGVTPTQQMAAQQRAEGSNLGPLILGNPLG